MNIQEMPSQEKIDEVLDWCADSMTEGTHYHGMTYEDGVRAAIEWMLGDREESPAE